MFLPYRKDFIGVHMESTVHQNNDVILNKKNSFYYDVFQNSMVGQIIVNENLSIVSANNRMFQYFHSKPYDATGLPFGSVFSCTELRHDCPECGKTKKCKSCGIWKAVQDVFTNIAIKYSVIQYSFQIENHHTVKWFQLNGTQIICCDEHYAALVFTDITELKQQEEQLRKNLTLDLATGTMNKYTLIDTMQKLMESGLASCGFTVCMIDFDNFKEINDQCGHLMGDRVLKVFSDIARKHIRKNDILGRYGGEEFIFVFNGTGQRQSLQILKRIHRELEKYFAEDLKVPVTFSAGVIYVDNATSVFSKYADLLSDVDRMLYRAKKHGRSRAMSSMGEVLFNGSDR